MPDGTSPKSDTSTTAHFSNSVVESSYLESPSGQDFLCIPTDLLSELDTFPRDTIINSFMAC